MLMFSGLTFHTCTVLIMVGLSAWMHYYWSTRRILLELHISMYYQLYVKVAATYIFLDNILIASIEFTTSGAINKKLTTNRVLTNILPQMGPLTILG